MSYPTWNRLNHSTIVSEEEMDGTPDFYIVREDNKKWAVKWRTSACWSRGYKTAAQAIRDVERQCNRYARRSQGQAWPQV
jgi:hypothetical protein